MHQNAKEKECMNGVLTFGEEYPKIIMAEDIQNIIVPYIPSK